jgi:hypothetical protein
MIRRLLHRFGYIFAHLLFFRAKTPTAVVEQLRIAYRLVGVRIVETPQIDGVERTIFLCPYRNLGTTWFGRSGAVTTFSTESTTGTSPTSANTRNSGISGLKTVLTSNTVRSPNTATRMSLSPRNN